MGKIEEYKNMNDEYNAKLKHMSENLNGIRQEYDSKLDVLSKENNELIANVNKFKIDNDELNEKLNGQVNIMI